MLKFYDNDNDKFYNLFIRASIDWNLAIRYFSREILKKKEIKRVTLIFPINQSQFFYIQKEEKKKRNTAFKYLKLHSQIKSLTIKSSPNPLITSFKISTCF